MKELIHFRDKAQLEVDKYNALIYKFCKNEYYGIDYRFEVWEKEVEKRDLSYVAFNSLDKSWTTPPPNCILDFEQTMYKWSDSNMSYGYLLEYVEEFDSEEPDYQDKVIELKEWLISENLGTWIQE